MRKLTTIAGLAALAALVSANGSQSKDNAWALVAQLPTDVDTYLSARHKLIDLSSKAFPALLNGMGSRDEMVRTSCASILAQSGPKAYETLAIALHTPAYRVRSSACLALGLMQPSKRRNEMLAFGTRDDHWWVRSVALIGLRDATNESSRMAVKDAMDDPDERVRWRAALINDESMLMAARR